MLRIQLPYVFELAGSLEPLNTLPSNFEDVPFKNFAFLLFSAESSLKLLMENSVFAPYLRSSYSLGAELLRTLAQVNRPPEGSSPDRLVSGFDLYMIRRAYEHYRVALLAELGVSPAFFVTQKGGYDTLTLLDSGPIIFPAELRIKVPESVFDAEQACKCLAYELATSCGFHVFRVTECVLRRFYAFVTDGEVAPRNRSIGVYVRALRKRGGVDERLLTSLEQMARWHRNPLIHPEVALTTEEAIGTLGLARSVIGSMLSVLPVQPSTTLSPQP